jgi:hypothetical protein
MLCLSGRGEIFCQLRHDPGCGNPPGKHRLEADCMNRSGGWCGIVVGGALLIAVAILAESVSGQTAAAPQSSPPVYAIPLRDGRTATVWWDAVSDPAHPSWRCEVPPTGSRREVRTTVPLTAAAGDWRAALVEAKAALKGLVADSE